MIIGRDTILNFLKKSHINGKLPHTIFFYGKKKSGKGMLAQAVANSLLCDKNAFLGCGKCASCIDKTLKLAQIIRPEFWETESEKSTDSIGIEIALMIQGKISKTSLSQKPYIIIIENAEQLTNEAANTLLKTVEEPPNNVYFIFTAETKTALLPTIVSRSIAIRLPAIPTKVFQEYLKANYPKMPEEEQGTLARFAQGLPGKFFAGLIDATIIKNAKQVYSSSYALLSLPVHGALQKTEELIKKDESLTEHLEIFFPILRSVFLHTKIPEHAFALKIPDILIKKFAEKYKTADYLKIMASLYRIKTLMAETNVNQRIAFENFLLEL